MLISSKTLSEAIVAELPDMRAFAHLMVDNRRQADEDVAAALTLAVSNKNGLRKHSDLRLSLFEILRKCIAQHNQNRSSDARANIPVEENTVETPAAERNGAPATTIDKAFMRLNSDEREVIILSVAAKFPVREIAIICESTIPAVEIRLREATKVLNRNQHKRLPPGRRPMFGLEAATG